jgi:hypothetical protein
MTEQAIDTRLARVIRTAPDRVEVRFKEGIKLDTAGIAEILDMRSRMGAEAPHHVMIVIPEDVDFEMAMMTRDHYEGRDVKDHTMAVAWVAQGSLQNQLTSLYLSYHPSPFRTAVFTNEADALSWLDAPLPGACPD